MNHPKPSSLPTSIQKTLSTSPSTELLIQLFSDRIFIVISQRSGKLGTLLQCTHEHSVIDNSHTYHVETLLGKRDDALLEVYIRQITERLVKLGGGVECPPVLMGIALNEGVNKNEDVNDNGRSKSQELFHTIIDEVLNLYQEGIKTIASSSS